MVRKAILVVLAVLIAATVALALYARSVLGSENVRRTLEAQLAAWSGEPVRIGSAGASIFPRVALQLNDLSIGNPPALAVENVSVSTGLRGLFSRRIEDAEVRLRNGRVELPAALKLTGAADEAASPEAEGSAGAVTIASIREISLENIQLVAGGTSLTVDMQSALTGDRLDIPQLSARSGNTQLEASGALTSVTNLQGKFSVNAGTLDLNELVALASGFTSAEAGRTDRTTQGGTVDLALDVTADSGTLAGYRFSDLSAQVRATPARVVMNPVSLRTFGGSFAGTLQAATSAAVPAITLRGKIAAIEVPALAEAAGVAGSITGTLGGSVDLTARGTTPDALLRSAHGQASAAITDGEIPGLQMVRTVVLAFGKPSGAPPEGSGSAFTQLGGDFTIQDGVVQTGNLAFMSSDFDMQGDAALVVSTGAVEASVDVLLSKELTAQAGTDLRRYAQSNGRIILPAHISGTIGQPTVMLDLAAATRRALENELKNRAKSLLEQLFRRKKGGG